MERVRCPECDEPIVADAINLDRGIATCHACNAVFELGPSAKRPTAEVPLPKHIRITDLGNHLEISWRWLSRELLVFIPFTAVWDSFLFFWYSNAFKEGAPLMAILFPILHLGVGVYLTYYVIAALLNTTTIHLSTHELGVRHRPVPWPGKKKIDPARIEQLYCTGNIYDDDNNRFNFRSGCELHALLNNGTKATLLSGIDEPEHALALEQRLERWLGIEDRHVPGELKHN